MSPFRKQKKYIQKYRSKWENMEEFKGWLKPLPKDITKAYCSVCNVVIKAHLCDLRKHGSAKKHFNAQVLVNTLKNLDEQSEDMDSDLNLLRDSNQDLAEECSDEEENASEEENNRWTQDAIESLIKHTKLYWKDLQDGLRKKKDIWEDIYMGMVSDGFVFSSSECNKKFRNMKLRYFCGLERTLLGDTSNIRIPYFDDLNEILSNDPETISYLERKKENFKVEVTEADLSEEDTIVMDEPCIDNFVDDDSVWSDPAVHLLLDYLKEFKDYFTGKEGENEDEVWQSLKEQMHLHGYMFDENQCRKKWHSMVKKFNECKFLLDTATVLPTWPYFTRVRHILNTVKIPTQNADNSDKRFYSISAKRARKRGRKKRTYDEMTGAEDSDASEGESSSPFKRKFSLFGGGDDDDNNNSNSNNNNNNHNNNNNRNNNNHNTHNTNNNHRGKETLRMMRHLSETASLWRRMDSIETRLDDLSDYHEIQSQTNSLLSQILNEFSILANNLSPTTHESVNVQDGITIVVPNSDHNIH